MVAEKKTAAYAAMVAEAVEAVAAVKDPELRTVAFEKILATLLEGQTAPARRGDTRPGRTGSKKATPAGRSGSKRSGGPKGSVEALIDDGFFSKPRTIADVKAELADGGRHIAITSLSGPLQLLTRERRLRRQKLAAKNGGTKATYAYSNW
jgi:hypothetical protein